VHSSTAVADRGERPTWEVLGVICTVSPLLIAGRLCGTSLPAITRHLAGILAATSTVSAPASGLGWWRTVRRSRTGPGREGPCPPPQPSVIRRAADVDVLLRSTVRRRRPGTARIIRAVSPWWSNRPVERWPAHGDETEPPPPLPPPLTGVGARNYWISLEVPRFSYKW